MEDRLDRLFRDKLANHKVAPTPDAWGQINSQLADKKQNIWARRLAIAASLLLLVSISFVGFKYLNGLQQDKPLVSQSKILESNEISAPEYSELNNLSKTLSESEEKIENTATVRETNTGIMASSKLPVELTKAPEKVIAKTTNVQVQDNNLLENAISASKPDSQMEDALMATTIEPEVNPEETDVMEESVLLAEATPEPVKNYPKVQIVYKADSNSTLLASNNRNLIDKGIKKITRFSDEHIVTDQVKTKLRNTKDDLLALNFGKILNKSNRELDN